jgi:hypothetical protein
VAHSQGKHQTRRKARQTSKDPGSLSCLAASSFRFACILCYLIRQLTTRRIKSYLRLNTTTLGLRIVYAAPSRPGRDCASTVAQTAPSRPHLTVTDHSEVLTRELYLSYSVHPLDSGKLLRVLWIARRFSVALFISSFRCLCAEQRN